MTARAVILVTPNSYLCNDRHPILLQRSNLNLFVNWLHGFAGIRLLCLDLSYVRTFLCSSKRLHWFLQNRPQSILCIDASILGPHSVLKSKWLSLVPMLSIQRNNKILCPSREISFESPSYCLLYTSRCV